MSSATSNQLVENRKEVASLVHPIYGHPLVLRAESVKCLHNLTESHVEVFIDYRKINVFFIGTCEAITVLQGLFEVLFLK